MKEGAKIVISAGETKWSQNRRGVSGAMALFIMAGLQMSEISHRILDLRIFILS
jgi:hypothetical protein